MHRTQNLEAVSSVTQHYPDYFTWNAADWLSDDANFAYQEGENVGFAEFKSPGNYWVHFCYHTARGRAAIELTKRMLDALYADTHYQTVVGLISEDNKKARWLIRQVGFESLGMVDTQNGLCEMFYSIRKDTLRKNSNGV